MEFSARQIADILGGTVEGDETVTVRHLSKIEEGKPGTLTFLANPKYTPHIYSTQATLVIVANTFVAESALPHGLTLIRMEDPYAGFAKLLDFYNQYKHSQTGIDAHAAIASSAKIGANVYVGPMAMISESAVVGDNTKIYGQVFIGRNVKIGANCLFHPGVRILDDAIIGDNCTFHAGCIVGSDGFGFAPNSENNYQKVAQIGNVIIEDHVEIGANTTIDRATLGSTIIRKGVKLDNLIQIAHNVEIGENTVIAAQTGIAGSTKIGANCMIGGQVGIVGHIHIADGVKIAAQSGISSSITAPDAVLQGSPAFDIKAYKMAYIGFRKLPTMEERLSNVERSLKNLNNE
ncbi:MAG: hypothetical protein RL226_1757 [Bacteroidota bacterium]